MKIKELLYLCILLVWGNVSAQSLVQYDLTAWTTGQHPLWDGNSMRYYGFGPGFLVAPVFPGPTLYANEGDTLLVKVRNQSQGAPHTIHWHGLDVDQYNDGVPNLSWVIPHQADSSYRFVCTHAGTYLYHCHVASVIHVNLGMYGNVIVRPADGSQRAWTGGPTYDKEYNWLVSETDKSWHDQIPVHNTGDSVHEIFAIPPYEPDYFFINGKSQQDLAGDSSISISAKLGEKIYLRCSNVGFLLNEIHFPADLQAEVIASDGRPLPNALRRDTLWVAPGERYGVMLTPLQEFDGIIPVYFRDINTRTLVATENPPFSINGVIGIKDPQDPASFQLWPNPAEEVVYFIGQTEEVRVLNSLGTLVWQEKVVNHKGSIPVQNWAPGLYFLQAHSSDGSLTSRSFIVR